MKPINHSRNSILTLFSWLIPLGLSFFATPFIVRGLGNEQYGLYGLLTGFIAYSLTFNVGRAVTKYVVQFNADGETEKTAQIISATFFTGILFATIAALILILFSEPLVTNLLQIDESSKQNVIKGFYIVAVSIWLTVIAQVFIGVVQAKHRYDIYSLITTGTNAVFILGNVYLVWKGFDFLLLMICNAAVYAVNGLIFYFYAKKLETQTKINFKFDKKMILLALKYGLSIAGYQLFGNILFIYERIIVTRMEGADKLTNFIVPMTLALYIHSFVGNLIMNLMGYASELIAKKQISELEILYRRVTKLILAMVVFFCVSMAVGSRAFFTNWMDAGFAEISHGVFILHLFTFGLLACNIVAWQLIEAHGLPFYNTLSNLSWLLIAAPLLPFLTRHYGIDGTAAARLIGEMTIPFAIILIEKRIFGKILFDLWLKIIALLGLTAAVSAVAEYFLLGSVTTNWFNFILIIAVCGFIYAGGLLITSYFSFEERQWIVRRLKNVFA